MVQLSVEQIARFKKRFAELDTKEPYGTLDKAETKALILEFSKDPKGNADPEGEKLVGELLTSFDRDGVDGISYLEFIKFIKTVLPAPAEPWMLAMHL